MIRKYNYGLELLQQQRCQMRMQWNQGIEKIMWRIKKKITQ